MSDFRDRKPTRGLEPRTPSLRVTAKEAASPRQSLQAAQASRPSDSSSINALIKRSAVIPMPSQPSRRQDGVEASIAAALAPT